MGRRAGPYHDWDREPRLPRPAPPAGACDCQFHIYAKAEHYPPRANAPYPPMDATFEDSRRVHAAIGFRRAVIVHSAIYGADHRLLLDTLENCPDKANYRGTANLDDTVSDAEIARLSAAGVNAARINFVKHLTMAPGQNGQPGVKGHISENSEKPMPMVNTNIIARATISMVQNTRIWLR